MSSTYSIEVLKIVIGQICQTIGWHSIQSTALDIMVDILHRYITELGKKSHNYAEHFGHTTPNLDEIALAFRDVGIRVEDLSEYIQNVESVPFPHVVPKYPISGETHLNFLKPGSREVLTRPVHVHEHLPPMRPDMEEDDSQQAVSQLSVDTSTSAGGGGVSSPTSPKGGGTFKRPGDPLEMHSAKRARLLLEDEGRPVREISSVMMTTSGFLSPAREGKLPEARTPTQPTNSLSRSTSPISSTSSYPTVPPEVKGDKKGKKVVSKKTADGVKKIERDDKKKETKTKEAVKVEKGDDTKVKKLVSMKEFAKLKALKAGAIKMMAQAGVAPAPSLSGLGKIPKIGHKNAENKSAAAVAKAGKSPPPLKTPSPSPTDKDKGSLVEGKLSSEPDKQKLNIFKKIGGKVKEERGEDVAAAPKDSRESSPGLVIDESELNSRRDTRMAQIDSCIELVIQQSVEAVEKREPASPVAEVEVSEVHVVRSDGEIVLESDHSLPSTPTAPRTPEPRRCNQKDRKRRRDRTKSGREAGGKLGASPKRVKAEEDEPEVIPYRPKTPEVHEIRPSVFPFFTHFPPAPGLIPPPIGHPLFPRFPLPLGKNMPHPAMPNMAMPPAMFMHPPRQPDELPEPVVKPIVEKPVATPVAAAPVAAAPVTPVVSPVQVKMEKTPPAPVQTPSPGKEKAIEKKPREHKKEKKEKDKTKKKKDKKDKMKGKERAEKKKIKEEKRDKLKLKEKKEKKEKRKEKEREEKNEVMVPKLIFRLGSNSASSRPPTPDIAQPTRKITIKPVVKTADDIAESRACKREPSPELARMSALITRPPKKASSKGAPPVAATQPPPPLPEPDLSKSKKPFTKVKPKASSPPDVTASKDLLPFYHDNSGNKVWICPSCGGQDDGSPMIGCDDCDAWYHWVCVGIQVPPDENEDWYCRVCIVRKQEHVSDKSKKKRKKKVSTP